VTILLQQKSIDYEKRNKSKKKPKDLSKSKEILNEFKEAKNRRKKEQEKVALKKKSQMAEIKKLPTFRNKQEEFKKMNNDGLENLMGATVFKQGFLQILSNGKWKDRFVKLTQECIIIDFMEELRELRRTSSELLTIRKISSSERSSSVFASSSINSTTNFLSSQSNTLSTNSTGSAVGKSSLESNDAIIFLMEITNLKAVDAADVSDQLDPEAFMNIPGTDPSVMPWVFGVFFNNVQPVYFR
jgi:hypothetical protein